MAYISKTQVKTWLDIDGTDSDTLLDELIARAEAWIENHTNRVFEVTADTTKTFDAVDDVEGAVLWLGDEDLAQVTTVTNGDGTTITAYVTQPRRATPYYALKLKDNAGVSWTYSTTPEGAISVEGRWGYSVTPPDDIVHACIRLVAFMYRQRDTGADADRVTVNDSGVMSLPAGMPRDVAEILKPYRKVI